MAYDEGLAARIGEVLGDQPGVVERKMFGGLAFMVQGHMCCGVIGDEMMLRVGPELYERVLGRAHARSMDFTGRPMKGLVTVGCEGLLEDEHLAEWIGFGLACVTSLPAR